MELRSSNKQPTKKLYIRSRSKTRKKYSKLRLRKPTPFSHSQQKHIKRSTIKKSTNIAK